MTDTPKITPGATCNNCNHKAFTLDTPVGALAKCKLYDAFYELRRAENCINFSFVKTRYCIETTSKKCSVPSVVVDTQEAAVMEYELMVRVVSNLTKAKAVSKGNAITIFDDGSNVSWFKS